jgi:peptide chain release factor 1
MFPSLETKLKRFEELELQLQDPVILSDTAKLIAIQREYGGLQKVASIVRNYHVVRDDLEAALLIHQEESDGEARAYIRTEIATLEAQKAEIEQEMEDLATAGDSITRTGLIMEIRAGTGGEEAALFAGNLYQMYTHFINNKGWKTEVYDFYPSEMGGIKEVVFAVQGEGSYHQLQFESGGHRVQRVPETEAQGRVHTSAATVAVLPEAEEVEVDLNPEDLVIETKRASGPGGQKVNKTESAIRIVHIPTGIVVVCQDEKSQHKNKARAMKVLRSRLLEQRQNEAHQERASQRRTLIGSGDRSQRIRTYNFPQGRVTDHRIGLTLYKLDQIMAGNLEELVGQLLEFDRQERLHGTAQKLGQSDDD